MARRWKPGPSFSSHEEKREAPQNCAVSGKRIYADERGANAAADRAASGSDESPGHAVHLRVYRCLYCMGWHLTSQEPGKRRPTQQRKR